MYRERQRGAKGEEKSRTIERRIRQEESRVEVGGMVSVFL